MAEKDKVFDVAKPGSSAPEIGSKPMVAGHKMMKDPTLKENDEKTDSDSITEPIAQTASKTIQPLDHSDNKPEDEVEESTDKDSSNEESAKEVPAKDESKGEEEKTESVTEDEPEPEKPEETKEEKEKASIELSAEREENLQKMINEKIYNVPIKEANVSATKTFIKTFVVVALLGILLLVILIDTEVIDLGISLPFNIL